LPPGRPGGPYSWAITFLDTNEAIWVEHDVLGSYPKIRRVVLRAMAVTLPNLTTQQWFNVLGEALRWHGPPREGR
jgi:hypothetical protein